MVLDLGGEFPFYESSWRRIFACSGGRNMRKEMMIKTSMN